MTTLFKFVQAQNFALAGAGAIAGATTLILKSFTGIDGVTPLTMTDFGVIGFATIEPGNGTQEEQISFTGITQNANGTATLTGVSTVLFINPYTATSGLAKTHPGSATFIISNTSGFYNRFAAKDNDETINATYSFTYVPNTLQDPVSGDDLTRRSWVLAQINGGPVSIDAVVEVGIAGEVVAAGNLLYFSETDNEWLKCDADVLTTLFNVKLGIAMGAGTDGTPISGGVHTFGDYTTSGLTQGDLCYASNTAGGINSGTPGTNPRVIGIAKDATKLYFDPYFQNELYKYAVDSVGTDSYAVTLPGSLSVPYLGMEIDVKFGAANTGASTLAINGGSAKAIVKNVSDALETGDIVLNQISKLFYNGTNWVMLNYAGIASVTQKGVVEQATPAEANAGTGTGATGAPTFISPTDLPAKYLMGVLGNTIAKTYYNVHLLFNLWEGSAAGSLTTDFPMWVRSSSETVITPGGAMCQFTGTGAESILIGDNTTGAFAASGSASLLFSDTNIVVMEWFAKLPATSTGDINMGFANVDSVYQRVYNSTTNGFVGFSMRGSTGVIYATISKNGVGVTNTDVSSGITNTNWNNFRIELTLGTEAKFYINGALVATLSGANLVTAGNNVFLGFGRSDTAVYAVTAPNASLQLI